MNATRAAQLLLAAAVALGATHARAVAVDWTLVAREGDDAPPVPSPHAFDTLADVSVRGDGTVFFSNVGPGSSDPALYRWSAATGVELLARLDLPDGPLGDPAYSIEAGFVAVGSQNEGPLLVDRPASLDACPSSGLVDEATFSVSEAGDLVPLSQPGAPAPGFDPGWIFGWGQGVVFDSYRQIYGPTPAVNASGELAFFAAAVRTDACSNDSLAPYASAVFGPDGSGGTALVAIPQQPAPGAPAGSALIPKDTIALALDDLGDVAFSANLRLGPSLPVVPAIYRWSASGGLHLVARQYGDAPQGQTFAGPNTFHLGAGGHLVFRDVGPGSFPDNFRGLYLHDEIDGLRALVQLGDPLPGLSASFGAQAAIAFAVNTIGDVAFSMRALRSADGLVRSGMWGPDADGNTVLRLLAGRSAPGLGSARIQRTEVLALSDEREILFKASLSTVDPNDYAYYLLDVNGQFRLLLRNGDLHELSPGVPEALTFQSAPLQWDPELRHFAAQMADAANAPVIVSTEVPEPGALLAGLAAIASLIAARFRTRWIASMRSRMVPGILAVVAGAAVFARAPVAVAIEWKAVAIYGMVAPGFSDGSTFEEVRLVSMGPDRLVFYGRAGQYPTDHRGIYTWAPGAGIELLASLDAESVSSDGFVLHVEVGYRDIGGNAVVVIDRGIDVEACLPLTASDEASFLPDGGGGVAPIVAPGMSVPGIEPGWVFVENAGAAFEFDAFVTGPPQINAHGDLAFIAKIRRSALCGADPAAPYAFALFGPDGEGGFTLAAMPRDPAPGAPEGAVLSPMKVLAINETGEIVVLVAVRLGPSGPTVDAIYRWDVAQGLRLIAFANDPELMGLSSIQGVQLGEGGHVVFTNGRSWTLFLQSESSGVIEIVRPGDAVPGPSQDLLFRQGGSFAVNALGEVAFSGKAGPDGAGNLDTSGVWERDVLGALELKLIEGQPAPHLDGLTIDGAVVLALSDRVELLIEANLRGPGVVSNPPPSANNVAFYLLDAEGNFELLVRGADTLEFAPGEFRPVQVGSMSFDAGLEHFAFQTWSTGGSAIFYASVPEPGSFASSFTAFIATLALARMRRAC